MKFIWEIVKKEDDTEVSLGLYANYDLAQDKLRELFNSKKDRIKGEERRWLDDSEFVSSLGLSDAFYSIKGRKLND